jgi:D-glycero-alpha-D-manno-heptose-7-phosphate kinase
MSKSYLSGRYPLELRSVLAFGDLMEPMNDVTENQRRRKRIVVTAPVRVSDVGGWTDTWFSGTGLVCNIAVGPGITVEIHCKRSSDSAPARLVLADFSEDITLDELGYAQVVQRHPVLAEILRRHLPSPSLIETIIIRSAVPAGSSLGTSASVGVALVAGLRAATLIPVQDSPPQLLAELAHQAETGAGLQSGVQDHAAAAFGGVSEVSVNYPNFSVRTIVMSDSVLRHLSTCLRTVFLGRHDSSATHEMVIKQLESDGNSKSSLELAELRRAAADAVVALHTNNMTAYGKSMLRTVEAQRGLHPDLISCTAQKFVDLAHAYSTGAKVNGAGGDGGSVTLLAPAGIARRAAFDREFGQLVATTKGANTVALSFSPTGVAVEVDEVL